MGLKALCMALTGQLPEANVVVNPFAWEQFLSGGTLHLIICAGKNEGAKE